MTSLLIGLACLVLASGEIAAEPFELLAPVRVGAVIDARIPELSGVVPVTGRPGHYWVHNDSDNAARLFAIREQGTVAATVTVDTPSNQDWEDIARGPGPEPGRVYLFIADTGDNGRVRSEVSVLRLPEPTVPAGALNRHLGTVRAEAIRLVYPEGATDAEALLVHPTSGTIYLLTKLQGTAGVYRVPVPSPDVGLQTLERLGSFATSMPITAADVSRDGRSVLVRTFGEVLGLELGEGEEFSRIFFGRRSVLPQPIAETKGEAICFPDDGDGYLSVNEISPWLIHRSFERHGQEHREHEIPDDSPLRFTRGDLCERPGAEGPAAVDIADAAAIAALLAGDYETACLDRADVNDDGSIDESDADELVSRLVRGVSLVAPFRSPDLDSRSDPFSCGELDPLRLISTDDPLHYSFRPVPPPSDWTGQNFDDSAWAIATGGVGFGTNRVATRPAGSPDDATALFARARFSIDPRSIDGLALEIDSNDGFVAYLNGVEVARRRLGEVGLAVPASYPASLRTATDFEELHLDTSTLVDGQNTLAVEVHNRQRGDTTLVLNLGLRGYTLSDERTPSSPDPTPARAHLEGPERLSPGDRGFVELFVEDAGSFRAASLVLSYDPDLLRIVDVAPGPGLSGVSWDAMSNSSASGRLVHALVVDPARATVREDQPLVSVHVEARAEGTAILRWSARATGSLPIASRIVLDDFLSREIDAEDFSISIASEPTPRIHAIVNGTGGPGGIFFVDGERFFEGVRVEVCGREAEFARLGEQTLRVTAPDCDRLGPATVTVCNEFGCVSEDAGFDYTEITHFVRGDANVDTLVDISDAVALLGRLFLGVLLPLPCAETLDVNADGASDVSDPVYLLTYLFQGGPAPAEPFPESGPCPE